MKTGTSKLGRRVDILARFAAVVAYLVGSLAELHDLEHDLVGELTERDPLGVVWYLAGGDVSEA